MSSLLHQGNSGIHLVQADVLAAGDVDEHALGAIDGSLQQRGGDGQLGRFLGLVLACGTAYAHVGKTGILHDGGHISEVQVDDAHLLDQVGDRLHRLTEHVICDLEGVGQGDLLVGGHL